jgi:diguanylate cyclase (GGDEF)-like protein
VLELAGMLQTTLDIEQQIGLFSRGVRSYMDIDGLEYSNARMGKTYLSGELAAHRASYTLKLEDSELGSVCFCRESPFADSELLLLENLLCGLVYPLRNAISYLEALQLASYDPLTGVQNRLAMQHALEREADLAHRQGTRLSMLLIDADHFKRFNDDFGHTFGDDVLKALANAAAATVRRSDLLFRLGGEEFVVLASHTDRHGAQLLAERIREAVCGIRTIRGREIELSVSIGVAELGPDETPEELLERADEAMYKAKDAGRNRVIAA